MSSITAPASNPVPEEFADVAFDALRTLPAAELLEVIRAWTDEQLSYALALADPEVPQPQPLRQSRVSRMAAR
jgi:hypothetical protein